MMTIPSVAVLVLSYMTSTNQNRPTVIHDPDSTLSVYKLNAIVKEAVGRHHNNKPYRPFNKVAKTNNLKRIRKNAATVNEMLYNNPFRKEEPHSYLYVCGDDDPMDISCHDVIENDSLDMADSETTFPVKNIFFIDASCKMGLSFHQVCSIESAAKANPNWQITVLFAGPLPKECRRTANLTSLEAYKNIYFYRIYLNSFADETPFQNFFISNTLDNSKHPLYHSVEILKYLILHKWGGLYLDTNMVVAKSFDNLPPNWIARENADDLGTAAMALAKDDTGAPIAEVAVRILAETFCVSKYCANGFGAITQALNESCQIYDISTQWKSRNCPGTYLQLHTAVFTPLAHVHWHKNALTQKQLTIGSQAMEPNYGLIISTLHVNKSWPMILHVFSSMSSFLLGFRILESKYFYPLEYLIEHQYSQNHIKLSDAHTYHIWSKTIPEESLPFYRKLAKLFCPRAFYSMATGMKANIYFENEEENTRQPSRLITERLAEPLGENLHTPTETAFTHGELRSGHNSTDSPYTINTTKSDKNKVPRKKINVKTLKTTTIEDQNQVQETTTDEEEIIVNFDLSE